jgi:hypothetical protein
MKRSALQVTSVPEGEAPLWVRESWVGLALPLAQRNPAAASFVTAGVLSGPKSFISWLCALVTGKFERQSGYKVDALAAVSLLESKSPEAAAWWRQNAPYLLKRGRFFVFSQAAGTVVEDASAV